MSPEKPIASLSLDVDNKWSYLKTHGEPEWEDFASYLDLLVPRVLKFLAERDLRITFFVVGKDAAFQKNHSALRSLAAAGHEIANHSFSHEPWFHLDGLGRVEEEIAMAEEYIFMAVGKRPLGFRGPGFSFSADTLEMLKRRGYLYDASTLPTFLGPLARMYYFMNSRLSATERHRRRALFGSLRQGLRPLAPYRWGEGDGIIEIPVTTMPILRLPIHLSYILYLATFSEWLALRYFRVGLGLCRIMNLSPSMLLHPLDFLGKDDGIGLEFFPAMNLSSTQKLRLMGKMIAIYCKHYRVVTMQEHASFAAAALERTRCCADSATTLSSDL
jgi:peptidoglycan-N-acetylglucosamine deacetylase